MSAKLPPAWLRALLRLFFKLLYQPLAWTYDWVAAAVSLGQWRAWVNSVLPFLNACKVLELGHGPGHLQEVLLRRGKGWCVGLDASPQMGRLAMKRLKRKNFLPALVNAQAQYLPFPANSFERVVATFPSEFIADPKTLAEIRRVLVPEGQAIVLLLAWITGNNLLNRALRWLYSFTGETFEWDDQFLEPLRKEGFQAASKILKQENSSLLVILLKKN